MKRKRISAENKENEKEKEKKGVGGKWGGRSKGRGVKKNKEHCAI